MRALFHLACFLLYAYVCYQDSIIVSGKLLPIPYQFFSKFVWLTLIDLYGQLFYHLIGFIIMVVAPNKKHTIFDYISRSLVGPIGVAVTVLFWALYLFDPATLAHDEMGRKILAMKWFNHGLHTLPIITAHLDLLVWKHTSFSNGAVLKAMSVFSVLYLIDLHYVYYIANFWAYPILGELPAPFRLLFIAACISIVYVSYLWLSFVHVAVHGKAEKPTARKSKAK